MQRIVGLFACQQIRLHGIRHGRGLHRQTDISIIKFLKQRCVIQRGSDQCLRRRPAVLRKDGFFHRARVDPDPDGDAPRLRRLHHSLHTILPTDIAGVQPNLIHARLDGCQREPVIKVDIRHHRQRGMCADLPQGLRRLFIRHGAAHDLTAGLRQHTDLRQSRRRVPRIRIGHGLDHHRRAAANQHVADLDLFGLFHGVSSLFGAKRLFNRFQLAENIKSWGYLIFLPAESKVLLEPFFPRNIFGPQGRHIPLPLKPWFQ